MWKILTAASTALVLVGTPAFAEFAAWDANSDGVLNQEEFGAGFGERRVFDEWDADDDGQLTEDEFNAGFGEKDDEDRFGAFSDWDADGSGYLDENEFSGGVFGAHDGDDDDAWGEEEYSAFERDDEWL